MLDFSRFKALTFDCYGTLIDWETGLGRQLEELAFRHGLAASKEELLERFAQAESRAERERPTAPYPEILRAALGEIGDAYGVRVHAAEADLFAGSVGGWPPFSDSREALRRLKARYKLVVVSNVDRASFARSAEKLGGGFDAVVTAEEVGAYKPDLRMFQRAFEVLDGMGVSRDEILHVAQSLYHDHAPAKSLGLTTVWVNRRHEREGWGATLPPSAPITPDLTVRSLSELADLAT
jgi:2-haloacid dehalogenase